MRAYIIATLATGIVLALLMLSSEAGYAIATGQIRQMIPFILQDLQDHTFQAFVLGAAMIFLSGVLIGDLAENTAARLRLPKFEDYEQGIELSKENTGPGGASVAIIAAIIGLLGTFLTATATILSKFVEHS